MDFSNQTVIVTGAAGNLGRAVASAFADGDANVVLVDRQRERLADRYGPETARTLYVAADLARPDDTAGVATPGRVPPGTYATLGSGRYVNQYVRRNGEWKLLVHEYVHEVSMRLEAVDLCAVGCLGRWDTSDISYLRPLQPLSADERRSRALRGKSPHAAVE